MAGQDRVRAEDFARFKQYDYKAVRGVCRAGAACLLGRGQQVQVMAQQCQVPAHDPRGGRGLGRRRGRLFCAIACAAHLPHVHEV